MKRKLQKLSGYITWRICAATSLVAIAALLLCKAVPVGAAGPTTTTSTPQTWVVAFQNANSLPGNVDTMVANAGGSVLVKMPEIGGLAATSTNPNFGTNIIANVQVKTADVATPTQLIDPVVGTESSTNNGGTAQPTGSDTQPMPDSLGYEQWDKKKLNATLTGTYAVQPGRKDVRVFVIDTGADQTHIDVAPNLDVADSRSFVPTEPTIQDFNGHGTWTISAVGAPINRVGISGVAPNVTLVEGKVLDGSGHGLFFYTHEALVYAGLQHFDVVSASLGGYIPEQGNKSNSKNGTGDHTDYILLQRATQFARANGVLPVAALGNDGFDLSDGAFFRS